jgi:hypothetical protein
MVSMTAMEVTRGTYLELVIVFVVHDALTPFMTRIISHCSDIDKQSSLHVNPSSINDIPPIIFSAMLEMRIYVKLEEATIRTSIVLVVVDGLVVVGGKKVHVGFSH